MKVFRELVLLALVCWGGFYLLLFLFSWWARHGMRRCFLCSRLTWMSPRIKAVMDTHKVIFCNRCMPAGDQLAEVATKQQQELRRKAFQRAIDGADD